MDHDDTAAADNVPAPTTDPNAVLAKLLQEQLAAHEAQAPKDGAPTEATFFGMTMAAIFIGFAISTIGLGLANYGRTTGNFVFGAFGVAMMIVPFFLTSTWALVVAGVLLLGTPLLMKRLQMI